MATDHKSENGKEKKRSAEILSIFAAHNFYANGFTPEEMRTTLEDLGPTYVKIGQIMSSRTDVLPEIYCKELEKLRQNVRPLEPEIARQVIEEETGKKIDEIFSEFRDEPLGSASIGQAHYAVLKDGTKVVVKVQRPKIAKMMRKDFGLLKELAGRKKTTTQNEDGSELVDLVEVIEELEKVTNEELDFRIEAANTRFFKENCIPDETKISCPTVIEELTTEQIFTMTCVDGYTIAHKDRMIEEGLDLNKIGHAICENFLYQVFDVGTFHGDPHQGNLMISNGRPYWIDLGMIGHITDQDINSLTKIVLAILVGDNESMVDGILGMGTASARTDRDKALEDVNRFTDKLNAQNPNITSVADMDTTELFDEITKIAERNYVKLPGDYTMLVRALITLEGVIEEMCPELDLLELITNKMKERTAEDFNLEKKMADAGKSILNAGKKVAKIPGLISDTLSTFAKGKAKLTLDLTGIEEPMEKAGNFLRYVVIAALACVLFLGSCLLSLVDIQPKTPNGMPLVSVVGIVFSIALAIFAVRKLFKK
ncbi:MAG: AarF/ABC1/UbiB kinase family protein [Lachnospiraceae bacterium]|nr:AarF/ABC1/UbiB kinase family protein [Lachnospiraceae bacterium]